MLRPARVCHRACSAHASVLADAPASLLRSVSEQDVVDAVQKQTTKVLEKKNVSMPDIKLTGTYDISVKLHAQVRNGRFSFASCPRPHSLAHRR